MAGKRKPVRTPIIDASGHQLNTAAVPEHVVEDLCRTVFQEVRKFFSNPAVQADYEKWLVEYRKLHPQRGGETT